MKNIKPDELFENLGGFLQSKGVELKDGSYSQRIRQGCNLLSDAINATQKTVKHAKVGVDKKLDQLRQCIHEATAPKPPPANPPAANVQEKTARRPTRRPAAPGRAKRKS